MPLFDPVAKKTRPINVGEVLYRVPSALLAADFAPVAASLLKGQLGVGVPGGCEKILHWANALLLDPANPRFAFQTDWAAAFQSVDRGRMFKALGAHSELDRLYRFMHPLELQRRITHLLQGAVWTLP